MQRKLWNENVFMTLCLDVLKPAILKFHFVPLNLMRSDSVDDFLEKEEM